MYACMRQIYSRSRRLQGESCQTLILYDELYFPVKHLSANDADLQLIANGSVDVLSSGCVAAATTDEHFTWVGSLLHDGIAQSCTLGL